MAVVIDHNSPCPPVDVASIHSRIRRFASDNAIPTFDVGERVCHQLIPESGKVLPGDLVVGADSHPCTYGALNSCATGLGSTDVAAAAYTGKLWFKVPATHSIVVDGSFSEKVGAKDLILSVIGEVTSDGATYKSVEFSGRSIDGLDMDGRMTIANMAVAGSKAKPELWTNRADFDAKMKDLVDRSAALAAVAKGGDAAQAKQAFLDTAAACKACHDKYNAD